MRKKRLVLLIPTFLIVFSFACNSGAQLLYGTPTPTLTVAPTQTSTTTPTLIPSPTLIPDYSKAVISLKDLPGNFEELTDSFNGDLPGYESSGNYVYGNSSNGQFVVGNTIVLKNSADRFSFKMYANNPETIADIIVGKADSQKIIVDETFIIDDVGEVCAGFRGQIEENGISFNVEFAMLQRGELGGIVANFYLPRSHPDLKIEDLMKILDGHFLDLYLVDSGYSRR